MTILDVVKAKIEVADLSAAELEFFMDMVITKFHDATKFVKDEELPSVTREVTELLKPLRMNRLIKNETIFSELKFYCDSLTGDGLFYDYLVNKRKLPPRMCVKFRLFYILDYFKVNNHMKKEFEMGDLQRCGLYNRKEDGKGNLIFYQHRLIIPYINAGGAMVYLRGRYFDKDGGATPQSGTSKYMGLADDSLRINRTKRFYNDRILPRMFKGERLLIVEGELDTIAGESLGYNTIGIPGASNIPPVSEFKKLLPFEIILCGDNDSAGNELMEKVIQIFMDLKKEITIKQLNSKDLNEFLAA